jgi:hypothetical protein
MKTKTFFCAVVLAASLSAFGQTLQTVSTIGHAAAVQIPSQTSEMQFFRIRQ